MPSACGLACEVCGFPRQGIMSYRPLCSRDRPKGAREAREIQKCDGTSLLNT